LASAALESATLVSVGIAYWLRLYPCAVAEIERWERLARRIPDPVLRSHALAKLDGERLNPEAAALFAVLSPRRARRSVVRLIVAYQVLYDYLDAVNEEPGGTRLRNGLQLHLALTEALVPQGPLSDYYRHHPEGQDGGYAAELALFCRAIAVGLPALRGVSEILATATARCAQGQSYNHAILDAGIEPLVGWAQQNGADEDGYRWWEIAAGGISCLAIHALIATAADAATTPEEASAVDGAYFPSVCALSALLDSLADFHGDAETENHSFVAHYRGAADAARRLVAISRHAAAGTNRLRHGRRHAVILAGITGYYLSSPSVCLGFPRYPADALANAAGPTARAMRAVLRLRRRLHER
jgi:tetraprenyl-beta-curcumene synthase